jgi:hypothetical protein
MDQEKFKKTVDYFKSQKIDLPESVVDSIQEAFEENDKIKNVKVYFKNDVADFAAEIFINNYAKIKLDGTSSGSITETFTYYGNIDYGMSENVDLFDKDDKEKLEVSKYENGITTTIENPEDYVIMVAETSSWNAPGTMTVEDTLNIYCPVNLNEEDTPLTGVKSQEETRLTSVYQQVKNEEAKHGE